MQKMNRTLSNLNRDRQEELILSSQVKPIGTKIEENNKIKKDEEFIILSKMNSDYDEDNDKDIRKEINDFNKNFAKNYINILDSKKMNSRFSDLYENFVKNPITKNKKHQKLRPEVQFLDLIRNYGAKNLKINPSIFKGNIFTNSPLLIENFEEINDFFNLKMYTDEYPVNYLNDIDLNFLIKAKKLSNKIIRIKVDNVQISNDNDSQSPTKRKEMEKTKQLQDEQEKLKEYEEIKKFIMDTIQSLKYESTEKKEKNKITNCFRKGGKSIFQKYRDMLSKSINKGSSKNINLSCINNNNNINNNVNNQLPVISTNFTPNNQNLKEKSNISSCQTNNNNNNNSNLLSYFNTPIPGSTTNKNDKRIFIGLTKKPKLCKQGTFTKIRRETLNNFSISSTSFMKKKKESFDLSEPKDEVYANTKKHLSNSQIYNDILRFKNKKQKLNIDNANKTYYEHHNKQSQNNNNFYVLNKKTQKDNIEEPLLKYNNEIKLKKNDAEPKKTKSDSDSEVNREQESFRKNIEIDYYKGFKAINDDKNKQLLFIKKQKENNINNLSENQKKLRSVFWNGLKDGNKNSLIEDALIRTKKDAEYFLKKKKIEEHKNEKNTESISRIDEENVSKNQQLENMYKLFVESCIIKDKNLLKKIFVNYKDIRSKSDVQKEKRKIFNLLGNNRRKLKQLNINNTIKKLYNTNLTPALNKNIRLSKEYDNKLINFQKEYYECFLQSNKDKDKDNFNS